MVHHILGQSRTQTTLFPEALDDFVTEDNPVRVVDVFIEGLDLETLGFEPIVAKGKGRPVYHPAIQLESK
jgi:transposase